MAQFDRLTVGEAHRRTTSFEQQPRSSKWNSSSSRSRPQDTPGSTTLSPSTKENAECSTSAAKTTTQDEQQLRSSTRPNALRCYSCGEQGHRQKDEDDQTDDHEVHPTTGDHGRLLVLRRACLAPQQPDDKWLQTNIFRSTCTIKGRICSFVIDSGSCRSVISEEALQEKNTQPLLILAG